MNQMENIEKDVYGEEADSNSKSYIGMRTPARG
jgi:hypothetical protein